jgi:hypothetical protein
MKRLLLLTAVLLSWASLARAQATSGVFLKPVDLPRWDLSGDVGWLSSNKSDIGPEWDEWTDEASGGALVGHYVTDHLKTELRLATSGAARIYQEEPVPVPGTTFPIFRLREHHFRKTSVAAGAHYQFFENLWFHPNLGGGIEIVHETDRQYAPQWQSPIRPPGQPPLVLPEVSSSTTVSWSTRPFVAAGFKWYMNERGFTRADVRVSFGRNSVADTTWTAGIGVDL